MVDVDDEAKKASIAARSRVNRRQIDLYFDALDAFAELVAGMPYHEAWSSDLTREQRAALRVIWAVAGATIGPRRAANAEKLRALEKALGTYRDHGDKDLAHWRATMLVENAVRLLGRNPGAPGVAKWLAQALAAEVDPKLAAWAERRDDVLDLLTRYTPKTAKGRLTSAAITAELCRGVGALEHTSRRDAEHATQAVQKAVKRYTRR